MPIRRQCAALALLLTAVRAWLPPGADAACAVKTGVRRFFSSGYVQVRDTALAPASLLSNTNSGADAGKTLVYRGMEAPIDILSAEIRPLRRLAAEMEFGVGRSAGGDFSEASWINAPNAVIVMNNGSTWTRPDHREYAEDRGALSGDTRIYALNLYFLAYDTRAAASGPRSGPAHYMELAAGYLWHRERMRIFHGDHAFSSDAVAQPGPRGPFQGLDSRSEAGWEGWRGGFRERTDLSGRLALAGRFMFGPTMRYEGKSTWNLRSDLGDPGYRETATGHLTEFSASLVWKGPYNFQAEGGYMAWIYGSVSGTRRVIYSDGSSSRAELDRITTTRKGWFAGLTWKY